MKIDKIEKRYLLWICLWGVMFIIGIYFSDYHLSTKETVAVLLIVIGAMGAVNRATLLDLYHRNKEATKK